MMQTQADVSAMLHQADRKFNARVHGGEQPLRSHRLLLRLSRLGVSGCQAPCGASTVHQHCKKRVQAVTGRQNIAMYICRPSATGHTWPEEDVANMSFCISSHSMHHC